MFYEFHIGTLAHKSLVAYRKKWLICSWLTPSDPQLTDKFCLAEKWKRCVKSRTQRNQKKIILQIHKNMTFNGVLVVSVAKVSAEIWQLLACLPEPVSSQQLLDLVIRFPLQQIGRLALFVCTFICFPHNLYPYQSYSHSTSTSSSYHQDYESSVSSSSSSRRGQNWVDFDLIIWSPQK